ncbi:hypothetical protein [Micromonospora haikouensis]|uniref:hypothetical protein n=1 Tax=Micromonospora haikouensis TaxID=686309 RepID=UPI00340BCBE2
MVWHYEGFVDKARLYFDRAAEHDEADDEFALWLLLGMEFLLRAPLAKVHPSLLAAPEGDSILHAAGVIKTSSQPRSIPAKMVIDRLKYVISDFGDDRQRDALYLANLRNGELHSGEPVLARIPDDLWLPRFLSVVEAVCGHLRLPAEMLVSEDILRHARALRVEVDKALERRVQDLISKSRYFFERLTFKEAEDRKNAFSLRVPPLGGKERGVACPACRNRGDLLIVPGRTTRSRFHEAGNEFVYSVVYVAQSFECPVCGLLLSDTAMVRAAGIERVHVETFSESRYEGWETNVSDEEIRGAGFYSIDDYQE